MSKKPVAQYLTAGLLCCAAGTLQAACDFEVMVNDSMAFQITEMVTEKSCEAINVTIKHTGQLPAKTMGHNWTLTKTADYQPVAIEGMSAGIENDYIVPGDQRVIAHTKIVGGGESDSISFSPSALEAGGDYTFFCSFPGHWSVMRGKFVVN
jgi:azurin